MNKEPPLRDQRIVEHNPVIDRALPRVSYVDCNTGFRNRALQAADQRLFRAVAERLVDIRGSFREGARTRTPMKRVQTIIGIISLLLIVGMLLYIAKFYSLL